MRSALRIARRGRLKSSPLRASPAAPPPVTELEVPKGFTLEHFGRGDALQRIVQVQYPEAHQQWSDGDLIVVSGVDALCFLVRLGHRIERLKLCPRSTPLGSRSACSP